MPDDVSKALDKRGIFIGLRQIERCHSNVFDDRSKRPQQSSQSTTHSYSPTNASPEISISSLRSITGEAARFPSR